MLSANPATIQRRIQRRNGPERGGVGPWGDPPQISRTGTALKAPAAGRDGRGGRARRAVAPETRRKRPESRDEVSERTMASILPIMSGATRGASGGWREAARAGPAPSVRPVPGAGDRVGEYVLEELLGEGGFGTVWRARHAVLPGKTVAVKLPRDPELVELLRRESILQHGLDHPGVLQVLGVELDGPVPYIVEEYAAGGDLAARLRAGGCLPLERALELFREIVVVIAVAHERGVVHRDLKPANILLDEKSNARVADFGLGRGLAALTESVLQHSTRSLDSIAGQSIAGGTWDYMSPEQRARAVDAAAPPADARADVWALGIILYELLVGERPSGRVGLEQFSPALDFVFARCWGPLETRYADARELLRDLDRLRKGKLRVPGPRSPELLADGAAGVPSPVPAATRRPRVQRPRVTYSPGRAFRNRLLMLFPVLVLVAGFVLVWFDGAPRLRRTRGATPAVARDVIADVDALSADDALRLGEIRRTIESRWSDVEGADALLGAYIAEVDDARLRDKAFAWRQALRESAERREYGVRLRGFAIDGDSYRQQLHSALEPGRPDVYVRVYHGVDGHETRVFDSSNAVVEAWTHTWETSSADAPSFRVAWRRDDSLRVELRESDVFGDNTIDEFHADGGYSLLLLSTTATSDSGHRVQFDSDFVFGR